MNRLARVFPPSKPGEFVFRIEWSKGNPVVAQYRVSRMSVHEIHLLDCHGNAVIVSKKDHLRAFGKTQSEAAIRAFRILADDVAKGRTAINLRLLRAVEVLGSLVDA